MPSFWRIWIFETNVNFENVSRCFCCELCYITLDWCFWCDTCDLRTVLTKLEAHYQNIVRFLLRSSRLQLHACRRRCIVVGDILYGIRRTVEAEATLLFSCCMCGDLLGHVVV